MPISPGEKLGPYEILAQIGAGGMGEVYKANDTRLDRIVAIKVSKTEFNERFEREARAVAALNHTNICQLYDVGPNYLVMEYVEGASLKGPLPLEQALKYAAQICDALDAAHKKGITHRDLKPAKLSLLGMGQWVYTHNGIDLVWPLFQGGLVGDQWIHHDQIAKSSLLDLGGGFAYAVTPWWQVFFSAARSVEGRNGHLHAAVVTLGVSRSFGGRSTEDRVSLLGPGGESGPAQSKAFVCTCARTN